MVVGLTADEAAAVARRTAALVFAPQTLAATEQRVRLAGQRRRWRKTSCN